MIKKNEKIQFPGYAISYIVRNVHDIAEHDCSKYYPERNITDSKNEPLIGVTVIVKGTNNGTVTDLHGNYVLDNVPPAGKIEVSYVGTIKQIITINNRHQIDVVLLDDTELLDEVVVTALGIKRDKKALGYAMQEIKTDGMTELRSESVANMLQGKIAGVQINQSTTGMGGSTRVVLRGTSSLSGANQLYGLWMAFLSATISPAELTSGGVA